MKKFGLILLSLIIIFAITACDNISTPLSEDDRDSSRTPIPTDTSTPKPSRNADIWEGYSFTDPDGNEYTLILVLDGNSFSVTQYRVISHKDFQPEPPPTPTPSPNPDGIPIMAQAPPPEASEPAWLPQSHRGEIESAIFTPELVENSTVIHIIQTTSSSSWFDGTPYYLEEFQIIQETVQGTFSISDDKIEFVLPGNILRVSNYSATENSMQVAGRSFVRSGFSR